MTIPWDEIYKAKHRTLRMKLSHLNDSNPKEDYKFSWNLGKTQAFWLRTVLLRKRTKSSSVSSCYFWWNGGHLCQRVCGFLNSNGLRSGWFYLLSPLTFYARVNKGSHWTFLLVRQAIFCENDGWFSPPDKAWMSSFSWEANTLLTTAKLKHFSFPKVSPQSNG